MASRVLEMLPLFVKTKPKQNNQTKITKVPETIGRNQIFYDVAIVGTELSW